MEPNTLLIMAKKLFYTHIVLKISIINEIFVLQISIASSNEGKSSKANRVIMLITERASMTCGKARVCLSAVQQKGTN